ncbi:MAG: glycosyltransferase family 4 protein [Desulfobacteraceae bacterium]|nr:glycosyltransferase family 4 protein [Desulfobacteraceae bacterium]
MIEAASRDFGQGFFGAMRILVLNYEFPPIGGGGGKFSEDLCRALAGMGHEIRVQTVRFGDLPATERKSGYTVHRSRSGRIRPHTCSVPEMAGFLLANLLPALRLARSWKPRVMHVHFAVPTGVLGWIIHRATGIPYVLSTQLGDVPGGVPEQTDHLFRWVKPFTVPIWRDAASVTAPSEYIRTLARSAYRVPVEVVRNGMDISEIPQSPPAAHNPVRLVFAGRFSAQKNLLFLIGLLKRAEDLSWEMDMLGDGPMMGAVRLATDRAGLHGRVRLRGWVSPERVDELLGRSDILIMPSHSEGLSVVGVRALAAGLAILGSDIGGFSDLVTDGENGYLRSARDLGAFEAAFREMLRSGGELARMKSESRRLAKNFNLPGIAGRVEELLSEAAGSRRPPKNGKGPA